jgi:hypothetical protein
LKSPSDFPQKACFALSQWRGKHIPFLSILYNYPDEIYDYCVRAQTPKQKHYGLLLQKKTPHHGGIVSVCPCPAVTPED